ncbi:MAG: glycoside hydrolase family 30 protein [Marinilabiliaceae bacterium]|nr:glycoside hydrolase family 30 protein [Marinilabiliaceae bacterium]
MKNVYLVFVALALSMTINAQNVKWIASKENAVWKESKVRLQRKATKQPDLEVNGDTKLSVFNAWGATFNELGWDALNVLPEEEKQSIIEKIYSPSGDLKFTIGRFSMNANDYAREWYSCDTVAGDFELKYFNIDRDKTTLIPYIKQAQKNNPGLTFWISPWSPPAWMKINQHYACMSSKYNDLPEERSVGALDYDMFIQSPRYLDAYARYFCKFIDAYKEQDIPITKVMYQNEAYSFWTPYPGCSWSAEGTARFNGEYLAPALAKNHPEIDLFFGSINSKRFDIIDRALSNEKFAKSIKGIGLQWEGGQILKQLREKYPDYKYVQTESECGKGRFDWPSAEHTFHLINHYVGNGCEEYTIWNSVLTNHGYSPWGWKQNALILVDSEKKTATFTPEYYAVKHYSHFINKGSVLVAAKETGGDKNPILVFKTPEGKYVIVAGNLTDESKDISVKINNKYLNVNLKGHSFNTFILK